MNIKPNFKHRIVTVMASTLLLWANPGQALLISEAESVIDWSSLSITTTGNLQLTLNNEQSLTSYWNNMTQTGGGDRYYDWNPHSDGFTSAEGTSSAIANDSVLNAYSYTERNAPGITHFQTTSAKSTAFTTSGSGTLTLTAGFALDPNARNTDVNGSTAIARTDVGLHIFNTSLTDANGDYLNVFNYLTYTEIASATGLYSSMGIDNVQQGSVTLYPDIWTGLLNISMDFSDGQTGVFNLRAHSDVETRLPEPQINVPEPASLLLFGSGLLGLLGYGRKRTVAKK